MENTSEDELATQYTTDTEKTKEKASNDSKDENPQSTETDIYEYSDDSEEDDALW